MYAGGNMKGRPQLPRSIKKTARATNTLNNNNKNQRVSKGRTPQPDRPRRDDEQEQFTSLYVTSTDPP